MLQLHGPGADVKQTCLVQLYLTGMVVLAMHSFDVESVITGFGSYDWESTHEAATQTAVAIDLLVKAGAMPTGKQTMDEFGLR